MTSSEESIDWNQSKFIIPGMCYQIHCRSLQTCSREIKNLHGYQLIWYKFQSYSSVYWWYKQFEHGVLNLNGEERVDQQLFRKLWPKSSKRRSIIDIALWAKNQTVQYVAFKNVGKKKVVSYYLILINHVATVTFLDYTILVPHTIAP